PLLDFCLLLFAVCLLPFFSSCGYHVAGRGDQIPKTVHTIAVVPFTNLPPRYKIDQYLTRAVAHELLTRTRFRVVPDEADADAVLRGAVGNIFVFPVVIDPASTRGTVVQISTHMKGSLAELRTGPLHYQNQNFEATERYQRSKDP